MKVMYLFAILAVASGSCRKATTHGTFPDPAAVAMATGTFITAPGIYESTNNSGHQGEFVDFRLSISPNGRGLDLMFNYETRPSPRSSDCNGSGTQGGHQDKVHPGWFFFVEKPGTYWFFDGRDHVNLKGHGPGGSPSKSIIRGTFVNRDNPRVPDAVLARLPEKISQLLSPPGDTRPSI